MADPSAEKALLQRENIASEGTRVLCMTDGSKEMGCVAVRLSGDTVHFLYMYAENYNFKNPPDMEQYFILDSLLRAGASYGEVHGAAHIQVDVPDFYNFFAKHGFKKQGGCMQGPVSLIVNYTTF